MKEKKSKKNTTFIGSFLSIYLENKNKYIYNLYQNFFNGDILKSYKNKKKWIDVYNNIITNIYIYNIYNFLKKKNKVILNFFLSNFFFFFKKIKFKGKGFKIKKTKTKKFKFFFGHSHFLYYFNNVLIARRKSKTKHVFLYNNIKKLKVCSFFFTKIKPISWYTKRGLRLSRQHIQKRSGKKSLY